MFTNLITLLNIKILFLNYEQCKAKTYKDIQIKKKVSKYSINLTTNWSFVCYLAPWLC